MNQTFLLKHTLIVLVVIFLFCPIRVAQGCGPIEYGFMGYSFFEVSLTEPDSPYAEYFLRFDDFYHNFHTADSIRNTTNLEEWQEIFCDEFETKPIGEIVYGSTENLKAIKRAAEQKKPKLSLRLSKNRFAYHLASHKCMETIDYLLFAKSCEPYVTKPENPWDRPSRDKVEMTKLMYEGERVFPKLKSNNIKLRYAFQLIRLAHYAGEYETVLDFYDRLLPRIDPLNSIMNEWILAHKAGALKKLGRRPEAAYLFSLVFDKSPSKREAAFQSFSIQNEEEWTKAMLLCQSNHERATLHALRANEPNSKPVNDMYAMYDLDPTNPNLELLLVREIKNLEKDFLGTKFNRHRESNKKDYGIPRKNAAEDLVALTQFVIKVTDEKQVDRPELWLLAKGYLLYLSNDFYDANKTFTQLTKIIPDGKLKKQLEILKLALSIQEIQEIDDEGETAIMDLIRDNEYYDKYPNFQQFLNDKLAFEYNKQGHPGKAFRCLHTLEELKPNPQKNIVEDLLAIAADPDRTRFEKKLTTNEDHSEMLNELYDLKGIIYWNEGQPEAALEAFGKVPPSVRAEKKFNPFIEKAKICVHCPQPDSTLIYTRFGIIEHIFELEFKAKSDYLNSDKYFYELGVGYFNLSYFGNSWRAYDLFRSGTNWRYTKLNIFEHWYFPYGNHEQHDLSKARFYFEKVLELTKSQERAARATFWLARIDWLDYATSRESNYSVYSRNVPDLPADYRKYYRKLEDDYAETEFYEWMIRECGYFELYSR